MKIKGLEIPVAALAAEGDENAAAPVVGAMVSFKVDAKVTKVDGATVSVTPIAVNGQSIDDEAAETPGEPDEMEAKPSQSELEGWARDSGMAN